MTLVAKIGLSYFRAVFECFRLNSTVCKYIGCEAGLAFPVFFPGLLAPDFLFISTRRG